jgi:cytochrome c oxidase subunit 3
MQKNLISYVKYRHPYHLVDPSPWPIMLSFSILITALGFIYSLKHNMNILIIGFITTLFILIIWFRDVSREGISGKHTFKVQNGLMVGMILFLLSEIMLFFSLFWAYFHSSLAPTFELGGIWPPTGITPVDPWSIPLLGSLFLLSSGATGTFAHNALIHGDKDSVLTGMFFTIFLGALFVLLQLNEYKLGEFTIGDSVFGSAFYLTTGLHGTHVIIGVLFLTVITVRIFRDQLTTNHHLGLEFALWYWHMVDVVWLFVFLSFYWWGS